MNFTFMRAALGAAAAMFVFAGQAKAQTYEEAVPQGMRMLVTQAAFDDALAGLQAACRLGRSAP